MPSQPFLRSNGLFEQWQHARERHKPDGTHVLLPSRWQLVSPLIGLVPLAVIFGQLLRRPETTGLDAAFLLVVLVLSFGPAVLSLTRRRVELGPTGLRQRNLGGWRVIEASDIQAITLSDMGMTEAVRIWTADGRSHRCVGVTGVDLPLIGDWWLAHRGADWRPAWGPPSPPSPLATSVLPDNPWQA